MAQRYILVLASSIAEGNTYAKRAGLPRFTYRAVAAAKSIRNIQVADVHVLPSFKGRRDRHAILAELRHGRDIVMLDVEMPDPIEAPATDQGDGMGEQLDLLDLVSTYDTPQPRRHKSVDPVIEFSSPAAADSPAHAGATPADAAERAGEEKPQWQKDLDDILEPEGWEPPETLSAEQVLRLAAGESGADVAPVEPGPVVGPEAPPEGRTRRSRCPDCGELTFEKHDHSAEILQAAPRRVPTGSAPF